MRLVRLFALWIAVIVGASQMSGCAAVVVGATVGGTAVALDSRDVNTQVDDSALRVRIVSAFNETEAFRNQRVKFVPYNGDVLLYGQVDTQGRADEAERIVRDVDGVNRVFNQIRVTDVANFRTRADDTWITTRVKTLLLRDQDYDASGVKVVTEDGEVFLFGIVERPTADRAIEIARNVRGVRKVVDVMQVQ
ncbi:BON domain-containing protein [Aliidiomarina sanyensis]|uniref:BON domain-containing protein n=1 Tax=Aliidiomarina sanyensis TaxID=1249555 RepID=A0A432WIC5_9GAMM|nr:BON domain-containing protein [Aliidiomarina sanyensis]RUO33471.1 BON domain-containing protein [Aliidiomarina sanyensis]